MASVFAHAISAVAIGNSFNGRIISRKFLLLGIACSILPDFDVVGHKLGIPYEHFLGHRGFTHSLFFALITGLIISLIFFKKTFKSSEGIYYALFFTLATASHGVLDALTNGGLGIAFFSPFDNYRYFFPWRPIEVSPMGIRSFFGEWGLRVILSEILWIGLPCFFYILLTRLWKGKRNQP
jgi:inner membrane protein